MGFASDAHKSLELTRIGDDSLMNKTIPTLVKVSAGSQRLRIDFLCRQSPKRVLPPGPQLPSMVYTIGRGLLRRLSEDQVISLHGLECLLHLDAMEVFIYINNNR